jgi:hypothetical protein
MLYKAVVILTLMGNPTVQLDDLEATQGYETLGECYSRGAEMIAAFANRAKIVYAFAICVENVRPKEEKGRDT